MLEEEEREKAHPRVSVDCPEVTADVIYSRKVRVKATPTSIPPLASLPSLSPRPSDMTLAN